MQFIIHDFPNQSHMRDVWLPTAPAAPATVAWVPWISGALHRTALWAVDPLCPSRLVAGGWAWRRDSVRGRFRRRKLCGDKASGAPCGGAAAAARAPCAIGGSCICRSHASGIRAATRICLLHLRRHHRARAQQISGGDSPATQASAQHSACVHTRSEGVLGSWRALWLGRGKRKRRKRKLCRGLGVLKEASSRYQVFASTPVGRTAPANRVELRLPRAIIG